ncbi:hypothetical protein SAMN05216249_10798 [Acetitomaculum ruminis DSM 5522]|uniref:Uncharacterized protein n=1 Tax=Acetitomaculum ruminis DSM 5522 TaxID=1120918 RepID=A0A1I0XQV4_9FIRM|nr:hypothetical protein [Acetitomaculum ruminis]SFB03529.1 hypothetical protein SAMN05216249_10798 [Acetitomaculum ruminis DSM 5522]
MSLGNLIKKTLYVGVGAAVTAVDLVGEAVEEMTKKGEEFLDSDELKDGVEEVKIKTQKTIEKVVNLQPDNVKDAMEAVEKMTHEEWLKFKDKVNSMEFMKKDEEKNEKSEEDKKDIIEEESDYVEED